MFDMAVVTDAFETQEGGTEIQWKIPAAPFMERSLS